MNEAESDLQRELAWRFLVIADNVKQEGVQWFVRFPPALNLPGISTEHRVHWTRVSDEIVDRVTRELST